MDCCEGDQRPMAGVEPEKEVAHDGASEAHDECLGKVQRQKTWRELQQV